MAAADVSPVPPVLPVSGSREQQRWMGRGVSYTPPAPTPTDPVDFVIDFESDPPALSEEAKELFNILAATVPLGGTIASGEHTIDVPGGPKKVLRIPEEITLFRRGSIHQDDRARFEIVKKVPAKMLGSGGFGEVYESMGSLRIDEGQVAVKVPKPRVVLDSDGNQKVKGRPNVIKFFSDKTTPEEIRREVDLINAAGQRAYLTAGGRAIVMKSAGQMDLLTFIDERGDSLFFHERVLIMHAILREVKKLHDRGYIHRDLKPENIMLDLTDPKNPVVSIIDFGIMAGIKLHDGETSRRMIYDDQSVYPGSGTIEYMDRELYSMAYSSRRVGPLDIAKQNSVATDAFALGGVFGVLFGDDKCAMGRCIGKGKQRRVNRWDYQFRGKIVSDTQGGSDAEQRSVEAVIRGLGNADRDQRTTVESALSDVEIIMERSELRVTGDELAALSILPDPALLVGQIVDDEGVQMEEGATGLAASFDELVKSMSEGSSLQYSIQSSIPMNPVSDAPGFYEITMVVSGKVKGSGEAGKEVTRGFIKFRAKLVQGAGAQGAGFVWQDPSITFETLDLSSFSMLSDLSQVVAEKSVSYDDFGESEDVEPDDHKMLDQILKTANQGGRSEREAVVSLRAAAIGSLLVSDERKSPSTKTILSTDSKTPQRFAGDLAVILKESFPDPDYSDASRSKIIKALNDFITSGMADAAAKEDLLVLNKLYKDQYRFTSRPEISIFFTKEGKLQVKVKNHVEREDLKTREKKVVASYETVSELKEPRIKRVGKWEFSLDSHTVRTRVGSYRGLLEEAKLLRRLFVSAKGKDISFQPMIDRLNKMPFVSDSQRLELLRLAVRDQEVFDALWENKYLTGLVGISFSLLFRKTEEKSYLAKSFFLKSLQKITSQDDPKINLLKELYDNITPSIAIGALAIREEDLGFEVGTLVRKILPSTLLKKDVQKIYQQFGKTCQGLLKASAKNPDDPRVKVRVQALAKGLRVLEALGYEAPGEEGFFEPGYFASLFSMHKIDTTGISFIKDLTEDYPTDINPPPLPGIKREIVIGDLHANVFTLIRTMLEKGAIELTEDQYKELRDIYNKLDLFFDAQGRLVRTPEEMARLVVRFKDIIDEVNINPERAQFLVKALGDMHGDRGANDFLMHYFVGALRKNGVEVDVIFSNHDHTFWEGWEGQQGEIKLGPAGDSIPCAYVPSAYVHKPRPEILYEAKSMVQMGILAADPKAQAVLHEAGIDLSREGLAEQQDSYFANLKLIDVEIGDDGLIKVFSHAPIASLDVMWAAAKFLGVQYDDDKKYDDEEIKRVCDAINSKFRSELQSGYLKMSDLEPFDDYGGLSHEQRIQEYPIWQLLWARDRDTDRAGMTYADYAKLKFQSIDSDHRVRLKFFHGHDGNGQTMQMHQRVGGEDPEVNLDGNYGKTHFSEGVGLLPLTQKGYLPQGRMAVRVDDVGSSLDATLEREPVYDDAKVQAGRELFLAEQDQFRILILGLKDIEVISSLIKDDGYLDQHIKRRFKVFDYEIKRKLERLGSDDLSDLEKKTVMQAIAIDLRNINRAVKENDLDTRFADSIQRSRAESIASARQSWQSGGAGSTPQRRPRSRRHVNPSDRPTF